MNPQVILTAFLILFLTACRSPHSQTTEPQPLVSESQALELAKQKFSMLYPTRINSYRISISGALDKENWYILFTGMGEYAVPGGYTGILVNKKTGEVRVEPGA